MAAGEPNPELAAWLKDRRAAARRPPERDHIPAGPARRRSTGLTQSDVARLAGIDRRTYQHFENGVKRPSPAVFEAVVAALDLTAAEIAHLAFLLDHAPGTPPVPEATREVLEPFLAGFSAPAMVLDGTMRARAWNRPMAEFLPPLAGTDEEVDLLPWLFTAEAEKFFIDYPQVIRIAIGRVRTLRSRAADRAPYDRLIETINQTNPLAGQLWAETAMLADDPSREDFRLRLPDGSEANLVWASLHFGPDMDANLRVVYLMLDVPPAPNAHAAR